MVYRVVILRKGVTASQVSDHSRMKLAVDLIGREVDTPHSEWTGISLVDVSTGLLLNNWNRSPDDKPIPSPVSRF